jgi:hypothetical protein
MDEARTVIGAVVDKLEKRLAEAQRQIQEFRPRLDQKSTNSSKPHRDARFSHATSNTAIGTVRARAPPRQVLGTGPRRPLRFGIRMGQLRGPSHRHVMTSCHHRLETIPTCLEDSWFFSTSIYSSLL